MPLNFPSNPALNQTSVQNSRVYVWTGAVWQLASSSVQDDARWNLFLPPAPTSLTATAGNAQVALTWTAPTVLAQTPITDYVVQYSTNNGSTWATFSDGTSTSTSATVTGLTNGTAYVFRVAAVNGVGTGAYATSGSVTPGGSVYRAIPTMTSATAPSGVVSATSFATSAGYEPFLAFDGSASTFASFDRASGNTPRRTLQYAFPEGQKSAINGYSVASSDAFGYRANEWQFHGSDDGSDWTLLDTQTNQADSWQGSGSSSATRTYTLSSQANFRMYRWTWSHADGGPGPNIISAQLVQ